MLIRSCVFLTLSFFMGKVSAEPLHWQEALEEASRNNSALLASHQSWQAAQAQIRVSKSANFPQLSASFNGDYGKIEGQAEAEDSYSASLSLSQSIFNGWQDKARIAQSEANASIAEARLQITKAQVSADLKTAFASLVYAQRSLRLQENIRDRRKANLDLVELRFQSGAENKGSVLLSRAYLSQADLNILQARNDMSLARTQLARALGRDSGDKIIVKEDLPSLDFPAQADLNNLLLSTPQHRQAILEEELAEADITLARSGYFPSLSLNGSYGRQDRTFFPQDDRWSVGVGINIPLYSGGRDYHSTQGAIANRTAAAANRQDRDRQILGNLQQAISRLQEAKRNVEVNQNFLAASEMRAEIGRSRYNNGLLSFENWDLIESDLISRQQAAIQSQRDYVLAEAAWENALGKGSIP